jgi:hypothetical protein
VVATAALRRAGWLAAAALAAAVLFALAFHGERPDTSVAAFEPGGGLLGPAPPNEVRAVTLAAGARRLRLQPGEGGWREDVVRALKLLSDSAPERLLDPVETAEQPLAEFGLDPPKLTLAVERAGAPPFIVHFGAANPLGLGRYARVEGRPGLALVPGYVAESWERIAGPP